MVRLIKMIIIIAGIAIMIGTCAWFYKTGQQFVDTVLKPPVITQAR